jgi:hypothetical protein
MDPTFGVPASLVARGYAESVEGTRTGIVIDAGWQYDWLTGSFSVTTVDAVEDRAVAV